MLYLLLQLRHDRYAIDATHIEEVIPLVDVKELPGAPRGVAGLIDYHGRPVPVVDLNEIALGAATPRRMSARIIIVWCEQERGRQDLIGLLVPRATDLLRCTPGDFSPSHVQTPGAPYLGEVFADARGIVQRIRVADLLTPAIRDAILDRESAA